MAYEVIRLLPSFNPCCIGLSAEARRCRNLSASLSLCFNPCCIGLSAEAFGRYLPSIRHTASFNPCCIGLSAEAQEKFLLQILKFQFQSLLYWIKR